MGQISKKAIVVDQNSAFSNHLQEYPPFKVVKILSPLNLNEETLRFAILSKKATFIFINVDEFKKDLTSFINELRDESEELRFIGFVASNNMYDVYRFGYDDGIRKIVQKKLMEQAVSKWLNDDFPSAKAKEEYVDAIGQMKSFLDSNPIPQPIQQKKDSLRHLEQENKRLKAQNENRVNQLKKVNANLKEENFNLKKEIENLRKKVDENKKRDKPLNTPIRKTKKVLNDGETNNDEETSTEDLKEEKGSSPQEEVKSSNEDELKTSNSQKNQSQTDNIDNGIDLPYDIDELINLSKENLEPDNDDPNDLKKDSDNQNQPKEGSKIKKDDQYFIDFANNFPEEASKNQEYLDWKKAKEQEEETLEEKEEQLRNLPNEEFIQPKDDLSDLKKNLAKNLNKIQTVKSAENSTPKPNESNQSKNSIDPLNFKEIGNLENISEENSTNKKEDDPNKQEKTVENQDDKIHSNKGFNPEQYNKQYNPQYNPQHNQQYDQQYDQKYDYISDQETSDKEDNQFSFISPDEPIPDLNLQSREIKNEKPIYKQPPQKSQLKEEVEENAEEIKSSDDIDSAESELLDDENLVSPFADDPPKIKKSGVLKNMGTFFSKIFKFE